MDIALGLQLLQWINNLAQGNIAVALAVILSLAAVVGLLLSVVLKLLRILLPWLMIAAVVAFCWHTGLLEQCWQWLGNLR